MAKKKSKTTPDPKEQMLDDMTLHVQQVETFPKGVLLAVDGETGEVTYPERCNSIWDALKRSELRQTAGYIQQREEKREADYERAIAVHKHTEQAKSNKRRARNNVRRAWGNAEDLCLAEAYILCKTREQRRGYLKKHGYDRTTESLGTRSNKLKKMGMWAHWLKRANEKLGVEGEQGGVVK